MSLHPVVARVTERIRQRSAQTRADYLARIDAARERQPARGRLSCGNLAHGFAAAEDDKAQLRAVRGPNLGIVTAYNDMLSAHQPFRFYPELIKMAARNAGGSAQVAGGVPAMCDGVTQGRPAMELSLQSRDVIAMATAVSLSHEMFDATLLLVVSGARKHELLARVQQQPDPSRWPVSALLHSDATVEIHWSP